MAGPRCHADHRNVALSQKILQDKPASVADRCTNGGGTDVPLQTCQAIVQAYGTPRFDAGEPETDDVLKCQLQPLDRASYLPIVFTDAQWAEMEQAFPTGVCDYAKPAVDQGPTTPWMTYQDAHANVIYGGRPLGAAPVSVPFGPLQRTHKPAHKPTHRHSTARLFTGERGRRLSAGAGGRARGARGGGARGAPPRGARGSPAERAFLALTDSRRDQTRLDRLCPSLRDVGHSLPVHPNCRARRDAAARTGVGASGAGGGDPAGARGTRRNADGAPGPVGGHPGLRSGRDRDPVLLIATGERDIASSLAAIVIAAVPLIVAVLALRFDHSERPTARRAVGLSLGFAGVIALVGIDVAGKTTELVGTAAVLGAAVGYATGPMIIKRWLVGVYSGHHGCQPRRRHLGAHTSGSCDLAGTHADRRRVRLGGGTRRRLHRRRLGHPPDS